MRRILFVRHGQTSDNENNVFSGSHDPELNAVGRAEAKQLGEALRSEEYDVDLIVASPLRRVIQTAQTIAELIGYDVDRIHVDERVRERESGKFRGQPITPESLKQRSILGQQRDNDMDIEWSGDFVARLDSLKQDLIKRPNATILVVAHNNTGQVLRNLFYGRDPEYRGERFGHTEVIQLYPIPEERT